MVGSPDWGIVGESLARLYLTGGLVMAGPNASFGDADLPGHQGRIALAALATLRQPMSHDDLADIVWDGQPPSQWKSALAAIMSKTRSLITATGFDGSTMLVSSVGTYSFVPPADMWIDVEHAARSLDRAEGAFRRGDAAEASREATVASSILRRPLLAGAECSWLDDARRRQSDALYRSMVTLAAAWHALGDYQLAAAVAQSAVDVDPYREIGHRLLIEAESDRDDRGAATQALERCEAIFANELGVRLSTETLRLARRLRGPSITDS
jgi:DNA-binding SARP family transcriptional activator